MDLKTIFTIENGAFKFKPTPMKYNDRIDFFDIYEIKTTYMKLRT